MKLYQQFASLLQAIENCRKSGNDEWMQRHSDNVAALVREHMPSGSGFDNGTKIDLDASRNGTRLVFDTSFHHMHESGMYDGWTVHCVTVKPSLAFGFELHISGRDRNDIKEYISEAFHTALMTELG